MAITASLAIHLLTVSLISLNREEIHESIDNEKPFKSSYDYIVVGAGSAGAVVAKRLSENIGVSVLLLEAGEANTVLTDIPGFAIPLLKHIPTRNWDYKTSQQRIGLALKEPGVLKEPRGKVIGGTSTINWMMHVLGHRLDFDEWSHKYGAQGWSYAEVLPYFVKLENNSDQSLVAENNGYHGTKGPIGVQSDPKQALVLKKLRNIYNELGFETTDLNGPKQLGTAFPQMTIKDGYRSGTGNAYIDPTLNSENLKISTNSFVTKIDISQREGKLMANGVEFVKNDTTFKINANNEVILSAGAYNSPQLLMLSGIGPKEHLQSHGIPVLMDLPVGNNLQDHPKVVFENLLKYQSSEDCQNAVNLDPDPTISQLYKAMANKTGPFASYSCLLTFNSTESIKDKEWPNIAVAAFVQKFTNNMTELCAKYGDRNVSEWEGYYRSHLGKCFLRTDVFLRKVRSFGIVRLSSDNPYHKPVINPNFYANKQDFDDVVEASADLLRLLQESDIGQYIDFNSNPIPGCTLCPNIPMHSCDQYIRCYIKQIGDKESHPVGTCRMGAVNRTDVVVDPTLKVKNVLRLRVCDASVMPTIPNGNTNAPSIMIGEKCSDLIKDDHKYNENQKN